jgi:hypothetical protein
MPQKRLARNENFPLLFKAITILLLSINTFARFPGSLSAMNKKRKYRADRQLVRVLAVLVLVLIVILALFSNVFRFGRDCGRTIGQPTRSGQGSKVWKLFAGLSPMGTRTSGFTQEQDT